MGNTAAPLSTMEEFLKKAPQSHVAPSDSSGEELLQDQPEPSIHITGIKVSGLLVEKPKFIRVYIHSDPETTSLFHHSEDLSQQKYKLTPESLNATQFWISNSIKPEDFAQISLWMLQELELELECLLITKTDDTHHFLVSRLATGEKRTKWMNKMGNRSSVNNF